MAELASGSRRRGRSKGDLREQQILDAVRTLVSEKSMAAVTIDDITAAAGISRTSFYFYFPSKQAVLARLMAEVDDRFTKTHGWLETSGPSPQLLRDQLMGSAAIWRENGRILASTLHGALATGYAPLESFIDHVRSRFIEGLTEKIQRDQDEEVAPRDVAPADLAVLVQLIWEGRLSQLAEQPEREVPQGVDDLVTAILRLIYGRVE